jgi:3-phosphoshikimate 1-carboxyvinyltransferase
VTSPARAVRPLCGPLDARVTPPGSKSLTNRALLVAALAGGRSRVSGALRADDTEAMIDSLRRLGIVIEGDDPDLRIEGGAGAFPVERADLDARQSGTTARFLLPVLAAVGGRFRLDGAPQLRSRPFAEQVAALAALGADVRGDRLPLEVEGTGLRGGSFTLPGGTSSQFASGLLLAGPLMAGGLTLTLSGRLVSAPYLGLTTSVMKAFGADVERVDVATWRVEPGGYQAADYAVEPDASAASYFFAAAAIAVGRVVVEGLGAASQQGDLGFVGVLEEMGAAVEVGAAATEVVGRRPLQGVDVDLADLSDTAQTLAVVAPFASSPTRVRGIGSSRAKETDRVAAVVTELRRCGVDAVEETDGFTVHPGAVGAARVRTYDDHRMAMSFALLGLVVPGIEIEDPDCVAKTFPGYWDALDGLR